MKKEGTAKAASGMSILIALGASLCCMAPLLALLANTTGMASSSLLGMVTPASLLLLFFPYYASVFNPKAEKRLWQQAEGKLFKQPLFKLKA